jgi:hypothetical protein
VKPVSTKRIYPEEEVIVEKDETLQSEAGREENESSSPAPAKKPWQEPKLVFVEPKLTKHGSLEEVTGQGFFGAFTPGP